MSRRGRPPHPDILTPREWEVLALLREGLSDQAIADNLGISLDGAKYHVREILSKLGVSSRQEAAAWRPEERAPASRWLALPLAARVGAALVIVAAVAGLGVLAWGVVRTSDDTVDEKTANRYRDCPPGVECPVHRVWERTGEYRAEASDIGLTILEFTIDSSAHVEYALTHEDPLATISPSGLRLTDDNGRSFPLLRQAAVGEALGVTVWQSTFSRPPDAGETLTFAFTEASISSPSDEEVSVVGPWQVSFIRTVEIELPPGYTEGVRIVEEASSQGASLFYGGGFTRITRNGEDARVPW